MAVAKKQPPQTGILGAIANVLLADHSVTAIFGNKINPGRVSPLWVNQTSFATEPSSAPYIILTHVAGQFTQTEYEANGAQTDVFNTLIQVAIFGNGFEQTRELGRFIHGKIRKRYYSVDNYSVWLQPLKSHMIIAPTRSEVSADIWQSIWQYQLLEPVSQAGLGFFIINGSGLLAFPGVSSSGQGTNA